MSGLFLGIDSGTQGTKAVLVHQESGAVAGRGYAAHALIEDETGLREQEPAWWIEACEKAMQIALHESGRPARDVKGIGVSGQQHGMVALDEAGAVIRPAKLWCDTATASEAGILTGRLGGERRLIETIGNPIPVGFTASKILWLKEAEPRNYERLKTVLLPHDYINYWLTGEKRCECGDASGTGCFDVRKRQWSDKVLSAIDSSGRLHEAMPPLIASRDPVGYLRGDLASKFGFGRDVLVASGGGDNMMAAIGTGNVTPGIVTASLGTSGTIFSFAPAPVIDSAGELAAFCSSDSHWLPLVCTMNVTVSTELTRHLFDFDLPRFNEEVASAPVGAGGIMLLPYFNGERTPALPSARATLYGLSATNMTRANICRAAMEGATLGLRYAFDVLKRNGLLPSEIRLVGGGARSAEWRRIAAGLFGCPVICPAMDEAAAFGAALQAMWCYSSLKGAGEPLESITSRFVTLDESTRVEPDSSSLEKYQELYGRYLKLNDTMKAMY